MRGTNIGTGPVRWMQASLLSPLLAELTEGLEPYPASSTWTPAAAMTLATSGGRTVLVVVLVIVLT